MDDFLKKYFESFKFKTVNTEQFIDQLKTHFTTSIITDELIKEWIYGPGLPMGQLKKPIEFRNIDCFWI